ncbi:hypothetical protein CSB45_09630 [candidate division KSB3 bacterium]|uniref:DUF1343 domain-containing protein n=1 Tax=candidate division KSB3 bacterium TaxID=2044937 RepID=A0A2G6E545_9BACT|nr:MAG: hypothetical protein CSB45_09630 [candidate division KSB3 bacterium]PIE29423.1 MAG: hypothetical protein CSA57_08445 [candidate division KSB3 bacterium]
MNCGIDVLLRERTLQKKLRHRRIALLGHPASVTKDCYHSLDALAECPDIRLTAAFGPQHGMRGDKQDNMIESDDYIDPRRGIPIFSLYGKLRYPCDAMLESFDVLLIDLQDIGTRIYTYVTTLSYMLEACARHGKSVWILDRPNPAGRPIEGTILEEGWESFIGIPALIMRHGLTFAELARWYVDLNHLNLDLQIVAMEGYTPNAGPGFGWPLFERPWINPSPNASSLNMARCFPGTVLFEGTTLSEGRGTTTALEMIGAPDIDFAVILKRINALQSQWLKGCRIRLCYFEPTFQKHVGALCSGLQFHTDHAAYEHESFRPYRLAALILKAIRQESRDYEIWHRRPYEYETERLAIDLLSGGDFLRNWVDDTCASPGDLETRLQRDEQIWSATRRPYLLYT